MYVSEKRIELIQMILEDETIATEDEEILHILLKEKVSQDPLSEHNAMQTFGEHAADNLAKFAGSWTFIICFFTILILWIVLNTLFLKNAFDIYPFILLNLILSCLAAIQAPVIMMSQNRQEEKDRLRAKNDYKVNMKSEIIIEDIHYKLDAIIKMQEDMMERINALEETEQTQRS